MGDLEGTPSDVAIDRFVAGGKQPQQTPVQKMNSGVWVPTSLRVQHAPSYTVRSPLLYEVCL